MGTLETAGGPSQSPQLPLSPHIPEQSWKEPPPPFLETIFTQNRNLSNNIGRSTPTHVVPYRQPADTVDRPVHTTVDASFIPHSHASSALLLSPPSLDVGQLISNSSIKLPAFVPITRQSDSRATNGPTGKTTTTTHYTSITNPTKTTEKEYTSSLHNKTHGETIPTVISQHPPSDLIHQNDAQPPSARPRQPRIVRVIRKNHTTATPFHFPSQPAPITITHSSPTIAHHAEPDSAARSKPRLIVRIRRNIPPTHQNTNLSKPFPLANLSDKHIRDSNTKSDTPSGTMMGLTSGRPNGHRLVVKVRRKGDMAPNLRHPQQVPIHADYHHHSNDSPTLVLAPCGPHHAAPPLLTTAHPHRSSTTDDNSSTIPSAVTRSTRSEHPADSPATITPHAAHSTTDFNRLCGKISSRDMSYRSFLRNNSVPVVPTSIWHHRICKYHNHQSTHDKNAATGRNLSFSDPTRPTQLYSPITRPTAPITQDHSTKFGVAHTHPTQYQHHRPFHDQLPYRTIRIPTTSSPSHIDDGTIYRPPWPPPHGPFYYCPTTSNSVDPTSYNFWPTTHGPSGHRCLITRPSRPDLQDSYCLAHSRLRKPPPSRTISLHCVTLPTSLTEDKNLLRPP